MQQTMFDIMKQINHADPVRGKLIHRIRSFASYAGSPVEFFEEEAGGNYGAAVLSNGSIQLYGLSQELFGPEDDESLEGLPLSFLARLVAQTPRPAPYDPEARELAERVREYLQSHESISFVRYEDDQNLTIEIGRDHTLENLSLVDLADLVEHNQVPILVSTCAPRRPGPR